MRLALLTLLLLSLPAYTSIAQQNPTEEKGLKAFGSYTGGDFDTINLMNGNLMLNIPLYSLPQRGSMALSFSLFANNNKWHLSEWCDQSGETTCYHQYAVSTHVVQNQFTLPFMNSYTGPTAIWDQDLTVLARTGQIHFTHPNSTALSTLVAIYDRTQALHPLGYDNTDVTHLRSNDGSGYLYLTGPQTANPFTPSDQATSTAVIVTPSGIRYDESVENTLTITDPDGNQMTSHGTFVDTMGRTVTGPPNAGATAGPNAACPSIPDDPFGNIAFQPVASSSTWDVQGANGATLHYLFCYTNVSGHTNFFADTNYYYNVSGDYDYPTEGSAGGGLLQSVLLPNGNSWFFIYDAGDPNNNNAISYADILQIRTPLGGKYSYTYKTATSSAGDTISYNRYVTSRTVDAGDGPKTWTYNYGSPDSVSGFPVTMTDPDGNDTVTDFTPLAPQGNINWVETDRKLYQGSSTSSAPVVLNETQTSYQSVLDSQSPSNANAGTNSDRTAVFPTKTISSNLAGQTVTKTYVYDPGFQDTQPNCRSVNQCGYTYPVQITFGNKVSTTISTNDGYATTQTTTYKGQSSPTSAYDQNNGYYIANRTSLPVLTSVVDQNTTLISRTSWNYDNSALQASGISTQHITLAAALRGHVTSTVATVITPSVPNSTISTATQWYDTGTLYKQIDGNVQTAATYLYDSAYVGAYPTSVTNASGFVETFGYDFTSGEVTSHTDANSQTSQFCYKSDGRLTAALYSDGGATAWSYDDQGHTVTKSVLMSGANGGSCPANLKGVSRQILTAYDGLGRAKQTKDQSISSQVEYTDMTYDNMGRVYTVTNPHRSTTLPTDGTTTFLYDALGRKTTETRPDQNILQWQYSGNNVEYWDELKNHWKRNFDALGRLTQISELGTLKAPLSLVTIYAYDLLNNLTAVSQNGTGSDAARQRSFTYDSLSRLITSSNAETGTVCYGQASGANCVNGYDANGNLLYKTDARGVVTNYSYDVLNRLTSKTYTSDASSALASCYQYDTLSSGSVTNIVGRLTAEWTQKLASGASCPSIKPSGAMTSRTLAAYDAMGRITSETQCVGNSCTKNYASSPTYTYDLAGNLTLYGNLIGTGQFTNGYDAAGRLSSITDTWTGAQQVAPLYPASLFSSPTYTPFGTLSTATYGTGLSLSRSYDSRLRVTGELDTGSSGSGPAMPGKAVISIAGGVQAK